MQREVGPHDQEVVGRMGHGHMHACVRTHSRSSHGEDPILAIQF